MIERIAVGIFCIIFGACVLGAVYVHFPFSLFNMTGKSIAAVVVLYGTPMSVLIYGFLQFLYVGLVLADTRGR